VCSGVLEHSCTVTWSRIAAGPLPSARAFGHVILRISEGKMKELLGVFDEAGLLCPIAELPSG